MDRSGTLDSSSPAATRAIGARIGGAAPPGAVIALVGPLGAGKTQLAKGIAEGLGVRSVVNSPTFILMNEHVGRLRLFHIDAYRLDDPEEALAAGLLDERGAEGVTVVEWADRLDGWLPPDRIDIELHLDPGRPEDRRLEWQAHGPLHVGLAAATLDPVRASGEPA
jgi:tRNA threonylcarbamoyladenosine biosynthesis protein TsaE